MSPSSDKVKALRRLLGELIGPDSADQWRFLEGQDRLQSRVREYGAPPRPGADGKPVVLYVTGDKMNARGDELNTDIDVNHVSDGASERFGLTLSLNADLEEIQRKLHAKPPSRPPSVLHITTHGKRTGALAFRGADIDIDRLAAVLRGAPDLRILVLGACHSDESAKDVTARAENIRFAVGFRGEADDGVLPRFSEAFYAGLHDRTTIPVAFEAAAAPFADTISPFLAINIDSLLAHLADYHLVDADLFDALERGSPEHKDDVAACRALWLRAAEPVNLRGAPTPRSRIEVLDLLDRQDAWRALLAACAPGAGPGLFIVTGAHDQDLPLFRDRIRGHLDVAVQASSDRRCATAHVQYRAEGGRARTRDDWALRVVRAAGRGVREPLPEALAAFAAGGPGVVIIDLIGGLHPAHAGALHEFLERNLLPGIQSIAQVAARGPLHVVVLASEPPPPRPRPWHLRVADLLRRALGLARTTNPPRRPEHVRRELLQELFDLAPRHGVAAQKHALTLPTWAEIKAQYVDLTAEQLAACQAAVEPLIASTPPPSFRAVCDAFYRALYPEDPDDPDDADPT